MPLKIVDKFNWNSQEIIIDKYLFQVQSCWRENNKLVANAMTDAVKVLLLKYKNKGRVKLIHFESRLEYFTGIKLIKTVCLNQRK